MRTQASVFWSLRLLILLGLAIVVLAAYPKTASGVEEQTYAVRREQMIRTIEAQVHHLSSAIGRNHIDPRVLDVLGKIPRHVFVPEDFQQASYVGSRFRSRPGSAFAPISPSKHQILLRPTDEQGVRPFRETTRSPTGIRRS
jgi:hypothetical protein